MNLLVLFLGGEETLLSDYGALRGNFRRGSHFRSFREAVLLLTLPMPSFPHQIIQT